MNLHDEIKKEAYYIYEKSGMIEGRDIENWLEAERIVTQRHKTQPKEEIIEEPEIKETLAKASPKAKKTTAKEAKEKKTVTKKATKKAEPKEEKPKKAAKTKKTKK